MPRTACDSTTQTVVYFQSTDQLPCPETTTCTERKLTETTAERLRLRLTYNLHMFHPLWIYLLIIR